MNTPLARRLSAVRPSSLNSLLRAAGQPNLISFAGGMPAMELFPLEGLRVASQRVLAEQGAAALQYGSTTGYQPLRDYVAGEMQRRGVPCTAENVILTSGAQQVLDFAARAFLDPGDLVITETPTYLTAIRVFQSCEARFLAAPTDDHGIVVEALPELIKRHRPKMVYTIPNFQNPTGITLAAERRRALAELAARHGFVVVEDDPYGQLR
jgi:2-aminoadipate transaminase